MPLYLALIARIGIPLPFAHQLLYACATLAACWALAPLVRNPRLLAIAYTIVLFNPWTYAAPAWISNRSPLMDSLALLVMAGAIGAVVRARSSVASVVPWLVLLGFAVSMFGLTREDTPWIVLPLIVFLATYLLIVRGTFGMRNFVRFALPVIPFAIFVCSFATIMLINDHFYGWPTTVETTSPELTSAYQSIARIIVPGMDNRTFPAPAAARELAYEASPAAAELKAHFDPDHSWRKMICGDGPGCDLSSGFFLWAFRDAVAGAGYYRSGADARAFYKRLSRELDAACASGRLACRPKSFGEAPNVAPSDIPGIVWWSAQAFLHSITYDQYDIGGPVPLNYQGLAWKPVYQLVAGSATGTETIYQGWLIRGPHSTVTVDDGGTNSIDDFGSEDSPDVRAAYGSSPQFAGDDLDHARFELTTTCAQNCFLVVATPGKAPIRFPLSPTAQNASQGDAAFHIDSASVDPAEYAGDGFKLAILGEIAAAYQQILRWWAIVAAAFILYRIFRLSRKQRSRRSIVILSISAGLVVAIAADCAALGLVSAISFDALVPEYEIALSPLLLLLLGLQTGSEGDIVYRWIRRKLPSEARPVAVAS